MFRIPLLFSRLTRVVYLVQIEVAPGEANVYNDGYQLICALAD